MKQELTLLAGIGLGAGLMYLFDPDRGRSRRAYLRDQAKRLWHETEDAACVLAEDIRQRSSGLLAEGRSLLTGDGATDQVVAERVRSRLGHIVSHPGSLNVAVRNGRVTLSGPILESAVGSLLAQVRSIRGVTGVENRLEMHQWTGDAPAMWGSRKPPSELLPLLQANWSPTTRLLAGTAGGALLAFGFTQRFPTACILGTAGLGLLARAVTNRGLPHLLAMGGGRRAAGNSKTLEESRRRAPDRTVGRGQLLGQA
jgi:hypothetical protein